MFRATISCHQSHQLRIAKKQCRTSIQLRHLGRPKFFQFFKIIIFYSPMLEITDEDLENLISVYRKKTPKNKPVYTLERLVTAGFRLIYGDSHYSNGKVKMCKSEFSLYTEHVCGAEDTADIPENTAGIAEEITKGTAGITHDTDSPIDIHRRQEIRNPNKRKDAGKGKDIDRENTDSNRKSSRNTVESGPSDDSKAETKRTKVKAPAGALMKIEHSDPLRIASPPTLGCWLGSNLAILTANGELYGYFRKNQMFVEHLPAGSAMTATSRDIFVGLDTGDLVHFDPIESISSVSSRHKGKITCIDAKNNEIASSSMDGTIFCKDLIRVSESGVTGMARMNGSQFFCSCEDMCVAVVETGNIKDNKDTSNAKMHTTNHSDASASINSSNVKTYTGHSAPICSISYGEIGVTSSADGMAGFLWENSLEMKSLGFSHHIQNSGRVIGYGKNDISIYDPVVEKKVEKWAIKTRTVGVFGNYLAYGNGATVEIKDLRIGKKTAISQDFKNRVDHVSFSGMGDMVLVFSGPEATILDIK